MKEEEFRKFAHMVSVERDVIVTIQKFVEPTPNLVLKKNVDVRMVTLVSIFTLPCIAIL